ncbi:hypothetical protein [Pseudomonas mandelii]
MDKPKVFISVGSNGSQLQRDATETIFSVVAATGLSPRQMEKNEWSSEQPLRAIRRVIAECQGAVIISFTRYEFPSGIEKGKNGSINALQVTRFPTVWNQIEAALAYSRDIPLLVVCESGLKEDGLLEGNYDWKVFWTDFQPADLNSERFSGFVQSWKKLVDERAASNEPPSRIKLDVSKLSLRELALALTVPQIWKILTVLTVTFAGVAGAAYKLGAGKWPLG